MTRTWDEHTLDSWLRQFDEQQLLRLSFLAAVHVMDRFPAGPNQPDELGLALSRALYSLRDARDGAARKRRRNRPKSL